jgi:hypothetical protein
MTETQAFVEISSRSAAELAEKYVTLNTYVHLMDEGIGDAEFTDEAVGGACHLFTFRRRLPH